MMSTDPLILLRLQKTKFVNFLTISFVKYNILIMEGDERRKNKVKSVINQIIFLQYKF